MFSVAHLKLDEQWHTHEHAHTRTLARTVFLSLSLSTFQGPYVNLQALQKYWLNV